MKEQSFGTYAFITKDKRVLLLHRTTSHKVWEFPGGGIEFGESPESAAVREAREETGLDVKSNGLLLVGSHVISQHHYIFFLYGCDIVSGKECAADEEHDKFSWLTLEDMEKLPDLALSVRAVLPQLKKIFSD